MEPIRWLDDHVLVLDQRKLPLATEWVSVSDGASMATCIQNMTLRGAPLIGIAAAYGLALEAKKHEDDLQVLEHLETASRILLDSRPTAVNLKWAISRLMDRARQFANTTRNGKSMFIILRDEALKIHDEDRQSCLKIGEYGAEIVPGGTILTHCNTGALATGGEGTAYAVLKEAYRQKKVKHVIACEARPYLQGARLTAFELKEDHIPFTLITDSMAGHFMANGKIHSVIVGADRIATNGDVANKIGTYSLAVLAKENGIPFFVAAPLSSIDASRPTGQNIPIEERSPDEVTRLSGVSIAPEGTVAAHPAFDLTPARYIHALITEKGVALHPGVSSIFKLFNA